MLGTESEFSSWVNQALEMANSGLPCSSAIFWLKLSTSRVVMPRRERSARRRSPGGWGLMNAMVQQSRLAQRAFGERYGSLCLLWRNASEQAKQWVSITPTAAPGHLEL